MKLLSLAELEERARAQLEPMVYDYFAGGSGDECTLQDNLAAFSRLRLLPRFLVDTSRCELATQVLGESLGFPVIVAPMAYQKLAHPEGEPAMAQGAQRAGSLFVLSTLANAPVADVSHAAGGRFWQQLYVFRDRDAVQAQLEASAKAGARAIVLTVDAPELGYRKRDIRNGFHLPAGMTLANLRPEQQQLLTARAAGSSIAEHARSKFDATLNWSDLTWLRGVSQLPILLKGILRADDARRAADAGVDGIIVSNHGGRQLDGAIAAIDALPAIVDAVGDRMTVLMDGGVRRGVDVLRALALGARAVLIGRPILWALVTGGSAGVEQALLLLREELRLAMVLSGCADIASIGRDLIAPSSQ